MMKPPTNQGSIDQGSDAAPGSSAGDHWPALHRVRKAIVVIDVVESVRLMLQHEDDVIDRWRRFVNEAVKQVLPQHSGRLVKSLGDGMLLEFDQAPKAVAAALDLQRRITPYNLDRNAAQAMQLRAGVHLADVVTDESDVFGAGVNLAARLAGLADPGQVIVSAEVCDAAVADVDAVFEDLGECYLKHIEHPVRAFRASAAGAVGLAAEPRPAVSPAGQLLPGIAVMPFKGDASSHDAEVLGELIADGLVRRLAANGAIRVISRLSSSALSGRGLGARDLCQALGCDYLLAGRVTLAAQRVVLSAELVDGRTNQVLWVDRFTSSVAELVEPDDAVTAKIAALAFTTFINHELERVTTQPLPTLHGNSLQLAATVMMHRTGQQEFDRAAKVLEHLIDRHPRSAMPRAWMAKWHALRAIRGQSSDLLQDGARAIEQTHRAQSLDSHNALALAIEGFVQCHIFKALDRADTLLRQSLAISPNEALAWLFKCVVHGFRDEGTLAWQCASTAMALSPFDPMRHFFDGVAASAAVAASRWSEAIALAERSLRVNRADLSTLRALMVALVEANEGQRAREVARRVLELEPGFTIDKYLARGPKGAEATRRRYARSMHDAGIPLA